MARIHWGLVQVHRAVLVVDWDTQGVEHAAQHTDAHVDGDDTLARQDTVTDLQHKRDKNIANGQLVLHDSHAGNGGERTPLHTQHYAGCPLLTFTRRSLPKITTLVKSRSRPTIIPST